MPPHNWETTLKAGEQGEAILDKYFEQWYWIVSVDSKGQRSGIDRIFTCKATGRVYTVEYKTDMRAAETGRAFIETVSVDNVEKPGWALTSRAQVLVYYVPPLLKAYLLSMFELKQRLPTWQKAYLMGTAKNEGYNTRGLLVPLTELESFDVPSSPYAITTT